MRNLIVDTDVINHSSLKISDSVYNGDYVITGIGITTFHLFTISTRKRWIYKRRNNFKI